MAKTVDKLGVLCMEYCAEHPEVYSTYDPCTNVYTIRRNVHIPVQICDALLRSRRKKGQLECSFLHIFSDLDRTRLELVDLSYCRGLHDECIQWVMSHNLTELNLLGLSCSFRLTQMLKEHTVNLRALHIDGSLLQCWCLPSSVEANLHSAVAVPVSFSELQSVTEPHTSVEQQAAREPQSATGQQSVMELKSTAGPGHDTLDECQYRRASVLVCPKLASLSIHKLADVGIHVASAAPMLYQILQNSPSLTYLDLSHACLSKEFQFPSDSLAHLRTLILFGAYTMTTPHKAWTIHNDKSDIHSLFPSISKLKNLRVLDIGVDPPGYGMQGNREYCAEQLRDLVLSLPNLTWLDIAGTGYVKNLQEKDKLLENPLPWLNRQLEFLGLLYCLPVQAEGAKIPCCMSNIPANVVAGQANEKQLCVALRTYINRRSDFLLLNPLRDLLKIIENISDPQKKSLFCPDVVETVLSVMERWQDWKRLQIIACACMFHVAREVIKLDDTKLMRRLLMSVFNAVERQNSAQMLRKAGMTLLKFKLPSDVMFCFDKFLLMINKMIRKQDGITRVTETIGMYILHRIASPLNTMNKEKVGHLGGVQAILEFLSRDFGEDIFMDDTVINAWSILYSITDEAPANSKYFVEENGVELFVKYYKNYPSHEHMLTEMMGVLSNVAEVKECRIKLMRADLLHIFCDFATKGDLEKMNSACSAMSHLLSDGEEAWTIEQPSREKVMCIIHRQVQSWNVKSYRSIDYRSLFPLAKLLHADNAPAAQHFAVWEICNILTYKVQRFLPMAVRDGVFDILIKLGNYRDLDEEVQKLVDTALDIYQRNKEYRYAQWENDEEHEFHLEDSDHEDDEDDDDLDSDGSDIEELGGLYFDVLDFAMDASSDDSLSDSEDSDLDGGIPVLPCHPHQNPYHLEGFFEEFDEHPGLEEPPLDSSKSSSDESESDVELDDDSNEDNDPDYVPPN